MSSDCVNELKSLIENVPMSLPLWQQLGQGDPQRAIADVNYEAVRPELSPGTAQRRIDALPWMVYWLMRYGHNPQAATQRVESFEVLPGIKRAWSVAENYSYIKNLLEAVKSGLLICGFQGDCICLSYAGNRELGLLDRWLKMSEPPPGRLPNMLDLGEWLNESGGTRMWFKVPKKVQQQVRRATRSLTSSTPPYLPAETRTPIGVTLSDLGRYWTELVAMAMYHYYAMQYTRLPNRATYTRKRLIRHMSTVASLPEAAAARITDSLTMTRSYVSDPDSAAQHDPQLTPIVEFDSGLFLVSGLIPITMPSHHHMKLLQVAYQSDFGKIGNLLGRAGEDVVAEWLKERLQGDIYVKTRLKVDTKRDGIPEDVDVVIYSPGSLLVVLEVKWHIHVDSTFKALQKEDDARRGRGQLEQLRRGLRNGEARVEWPESWGDVDTDPCQRRWFVVTNDTTPVHNLGISDIKIRASLLIKHALQHGSSIGELVDLLDSPPTPVVGETRWTTIDYGNVTLTVEQIQPHPEQPQLFKNLEPNRRTEQ